MQIFTPLACPGAPVFLRVRWESLEKRPVLIIPVSVPCVFEDGPAASPLYISVLVCVTMVSPAVHITEKSDLIKWLLFKPAL